MFSLKQSPIRQIMQLLAAASSPTWTRTKTNLLQRQACYHYTMGEYASSERFPLKSQDDS